MTVPALIKFLFPKGEDYEGQRNWRIFVVIALAAGLIFCLWALGFGGSGFALASDVNKQIEQIDQTLQQINRRMDRSDRKVSRMLELQFITSLRALSEQKCDEPDPMRRIQLQRIIDFYSAEYTGLTGREPPPPTC